MVTYVQMWDERNILAKVVKKWRLNIQLMNWVLCHYINLRQSMDCGKPIVVEDKNLISQAYFHIEVNNAKISNLNKTLVENFQYSS